MRHPCIARTCWRGLRGWSPQPRSGSFQRGRMLVIYLRAAREEEQRFIGSPLADSYQLYRSRTGQFLPNPLSCLWLDVPHDKKLEDAASLAHIAHERTRFVVTVLGITCATLLMLVQGSILLGFLGAASKSSIPRTPTFGSPAEGALF